MFLLSQGVTELLILYFFFDLNYYIDIILNLIFK